jgi:hypothetical protein
LQFDLRTYHAGDHTRDQVITPLDDSGLTVSAIPSTGEHKPGLVVISPRFTWRVTHREMDRVLLRLAADDVAQHSLGEPDDRLGLELEGPGLATALVPDHMQTSIRGDVVYDTRDRPLDTS